MKSMTNNRFISKLLTLIGCSVCLGANLNAIGQTSAELETIIKTSNGIDSSRPIRAFMDNGVATVSTFSHPKATDQDCKINSLFIMKALMERYKNIRGLRITFYNSKFASRFRMLEISREQVRRIDAGRPVQEELSKVRIVSGQRPVQIVAPPNSAATPHTSERQLTAPTPALSATQRQQLREFNHTLDNIKEISKTILGR